MTYEQAFTWLKTREATATFVTVGDETVAVISALNGSLKGQSPDFLQAVGQCVRREKEFIAAGKISDRTPIMRRILDWHAEYDEATKAGIRLHDEPKSKSRPIPTSTSLKGGD